MNKITAKEIVEILNMEPLDGEGGYVFQTYISDEILPNSVIPGRKGDKPYGSAILYLITEKSFSRIHRLATDEIFHFYMGDSVEQLHLYPDGTSEIVKMGHNIKDGEKLQVLAPRGVWQGTKLISGGQNKWALLGTTMAPGYHDNDFEGGSMDELIEQYPEQEELLRILAASPYFDI